MKKLRLGLDDLQVESFETVSGVHAYQFGIDMGAAMLAPTDSCPGTCLSCQTDPCGTCGVTCSCGGTCGESCQTDACGSCGGVVCHTDPDPSETNNQ
jgi:hypothetical protein